MLQAPLQPLQDNLESQTYETFEKDRTKYDTYEAAVYAALLDQPQKANQQAVIIMVVGAGRGPLITASLQVSLPLGCNCNVHCVEQPQLAASVSRVHTGHTHSCHTVPVRFQQAVIVIMVGAGRDLFITASLQVSLPPGCSIH